jgi:hypothetical protein
MDATAPPRQRYTLEVDCLYGGSIASRAPGKIALSLILDAEDLQALHDASAQCLQSRPPQDGLAVSPPLPHERRQP